MCCNIATRTKIIWQIQIRCIASEEETCQKAKYYYGGNHAHSLSARLRVEKSETALLGYIRLCSLVHECLYFSSLIENINAVESQGI